MTLHIVFLDRETVPPQVTMPAPRTDHDWTDYDRTDPDQVVERCKEAEVVVTNKVAMPADVIERLPRLKLIAVAATGVDRIDLEACEARGIGVANIRDYANVTVPEHVIAMMFMLRRHLVAYHRAVANGRWAEVDQFSFFDYPIHDLKGATMGIVGGGSLGTRVRELAEGLGMQVLMAEHQGATVIRDGRVPFPEMLAESEVISLHCPLTEDTRGLIGRAEFRAMLKKPILINTARGGVVDEDALVEALDEGRIAAAGFDVVTQEPMPADHPFHRLMDRPNFLLTPHVGWSSLEAIQGLADQLVACIDSFAEGGEKNRVV